MAADLTGRGKTIGEAAVPEASASAADGVTDMMGRLKLTSKESKKFVIDDSVGDGGNYPERALVGKVLAPNTLHVNTITSFVRSAWENPRGMMVRSIGPNLFLVEFESQVELQRVVNGSPWTLGKKHAILLKRFDPMVMPADMVFDRLLLSVRIYGLPFRLMNSENGGPLAAMIGEVVKVEVDEKGRAWGEYLHVRIDVDISEPLMRCVAVESSSMKRTLYYEVRYEKLPLFCFSCDLVGHSSVTCPTPAARDEMGKLPWDGDRVMFLRCGEKTVHFRARDLPKVLVLIQVVQIRDNLR
jgi:hypothetical protein